MPRAINIRLQDGRCIMLVAASAVASWNAEQAKRRLWDAVDDQPFVGQDLVRLADKERLVSSWDASVGEAIEAIASAFASGRLTAVRIDDARRGSRPLLRGAEPIDWDNLRPLSDLIRVDPVPPPSGPKAPAAPAWVDPRDAWISFDVVDDGGVPADGEFRGVIEGSTRDGALERTSHTFRDLSTSATGRVRLAGLSFEATVITLDGPVPGGTPMEPGVPGDATATFASFDVVDAEGRPVRGRYVARTPAGELGGVLGGVIALPEPGAASVRLLLGSTDAHR